MKIFSYYIFAQILPVCSCKNSSAHNIISSVGSIPRTGPRGVLTAPAGGACAVHDSSCVRPPQQPRMMLVGTEVNVKSVAQVSHRSVLLSFW
jgi:hypothetical protein